jgi:hypothetical protein
VPVIDLLDPATGESSNTLDKINGPASCIIAKTSEALASSVHADDAAGHEVRESWVIGCAYFCVQIEVVEVVGCRARPGRCAGLSGRVGCRGPSGRPVCIRLHGSHQNGAFPMQLNLKTRDLGQIEAESAHPVGKSVGCNHTEGRDLTDMRSDSRDQLLQERSGT